MSSLKRLTHPLGPHSFDMGERYFWLDLSRAPVIDAAEEQRIETRWYGPIVVLAAAGLPTDPLLNVVIVLTERGYRRAETLVRFTRPSSPPGFPMPPSIEVEEIEEYREGFSELAGEGFGMEFGSAFVDGLPGRDAWHCYMALDDEGPLASASMMLQESTVQFGFAGTAEGARRRGAHLALLHRRLLDASRIGVYRGVFAETVESSGDLGGPTPAARNLARAGFTQAAVRQVWRPA